MSLPSLPQSCEEPEPRRRALAEQAEPYRYTYDAFPEIACSATVPEHEQPSMSWLAKVADTLLEVMINDAAVNRRLEEANPDDTMQRAIRGIVLTVGGGTQGGMLAVFDKLASLLESQVAPLAAPRRSISSYLGAFVTAPLPGVARRYQFDSTFAQMRVGGPNPMMLTRVTRLPDHFPVTEAHFERARALHQARGTEMGDDTLACALGEGRLFLCDYAVLDGAPCGTFPLGQKYLYAPLALFVTARVDRTLLPVAIQCGQRPGPDAPVFTPADGTAWAMAKTCVQVADGNVHQAVSHLAHTHLVTEPFVVALQRNVAPTHPLHRLLRPHHEGTLVINDAANKRLTAPGGGVDAILGGTIEYSRAAAVAGVQSWDFRGSMLRTNLAARGVDDTHTLPNYPYRDDALLLWDAIHDWVASVVNTYYTEGEVGRDSEVQAFFAEAGAADGGRLRGIGAIETRDELINAVTHLIFTGSAQHAAVNFPQKSLMAFAPNLPLAGYRPAPTSTDVPATAWLDMLPPLPVAQYQSMLGDLLGSCHHTALGDYDVPVFGHFGGDARLDAPLEDFRARLVNIEGIITERNRSRPSYKFLLPTKIPQGINI